MFQRPAASNIFSRHVAPREIASNRAILPQLSEVSSVDRALYFFQFQAVLAGRGRPYEPNGTRAGLQLGRGAACEHMPLLNIISLYTVIAWTTSLPCTAVP